MPHASPGPRARVASIDALRGLVMIVMALDHTREYFHSAAILFNPEDLARTTPALFFTRWVTHFCAPVFMLTAGLGAYYWRAAGHTTRELSRFLVTRGLWLVLLEVTVLRLAYYFGLGGPVLLTILWALGGSMVILAVLVRLPLRLLAPLAMAVVVLHNLADSFRPDSWPWKLAHSGGAIQAHGVAIVVGYPLVPWFAVMALGFCAGPLMALEAPRRRRALLLAGAALTVAFVVLRASNVYGNPEPWARPSVLSFLKCLKYPPSLDFLLMTLGPALLVLAWLDGLRLAPGNPLLVFGRVPLFYFLVHLFLIHGLTVPLALLRYGHAGFVFGSPPTRESYPAGYGYSLGTVYVIWLVVVAVSYPLCRWFAAVKQRRRDWWLAYL